MDQALAAAHRVCNPISYAWPDFLCLNRGFKKLFLSPHWAQPPRLQKIPTPPTAIKHKPPAFCEIMSFLAHEPLQQSSWIINRERVSHVVFH